MKDSDDSQSGGGIITNEKLEINFDAFTYPEGKESAKCFKILGDKTECLTQLKKSLSNNLDNALAAIEDNKKFISRIDKNH